MKLETLDNKGIMITNLFRELDKPKKRRISVMGNKNKSIDDKILTRAAPCRQPAARRIRRPGPELVEEINRFVMYFIDYRRDLEDLTNK